MKQVIVMRTDLNMSAGKMIAQGAHASLNAYLDANDSTKHNWMAIGHKKITCKISSEEKLLNIAKKCKEAGLPYAVVADWGLTEVPANTITCMAIGPAKDEDIDKITKRLSLL